MAEPSWPMLEVMQEHHQNLVIQGYMTMAALAAPHVPEDPASPAPMRGYIAACAVFYE
jgi:hypothetical protein